MLVRKSEMFINGKCSIYYGDDSYFHEENGVGGVRVKSCGVRVKSCTI